MVANLTATSVCLAALVDKAIEDGNTSVIEEIEDKNHLKYMQKDVEMRLLRNGSILSSKSLYVGDTGIGFCAIAIGLFFFSIGISIDDSYKIMHSIGGLFIICIGIIIVITAHTKWSKKTDKDIEFMCDLILKIEEKLLK